MTVVPFRWRPVAVDWSGLEGAFTFGSDEASHYFDVTTGEVHDRVWEAIRAWIEDHGIQPRTSELAKVTYDRGMCSELPPGPRDLTRSKWEAPFIPDGILWSLEREGILDLSGTWGDPVIGDPIEVDVIRVRGRGVSADLTFYNRGITLFRTDSEEIRRIHRFCCTLANTPPSG